MDDNIILVDFLDREIGYEEKMKAHASPMLHRAFSIFLYHDGKFLLQRRALGKYHSGSLWANTRERWFQTHRRLRRWHGSAWRNCWMTWWNGRLSTLPGC